MWLVSGEVDGTVLALDGGAFTVQNTADDSCHLVRSDDVESWGVATESGFCIGPWVRLQGSGHRRRRSTLDAADDGPLLCSECGKPLDETHSHEPT